MKRKDSIRMLPSNHDGWVYFHSPLMHATGYGNKMSKTDALRVYRDYRMLVEGCKRSNNIRGLVTDTKEDYHTIQDLLHRLGFRPFRVVDGNIWFKMEV